MPDGHETAIQDIVDRAYGEDHLRDCMGYKSFGEWPCDCIIGDLCDEVEVLRAIVREVATIDKRSPWKRLQDASLRHPEVSARALASGS